MSELAGRLGTTDERILILEGLIQYRALLGRLGYAQGFQLVDGSFVENVEHTQSRSPADVDVFSFLHLPTIGTSGGRLDATGENAWLTEIADKDRNKARFRVDSYATLVDELDSYAMFQISNYWTSLFAHQRRTSAWKGFVAVPLDPADDASASQILTAAAGRS